MVRSVRVAAILAWSLFFLSFGSGIAYAEESVSLVDGFSSGVQTLVHPDEVVSEQVSPEVDYAQSYVPVYAPLSTGEEVVVEDDSTAYRTVIDACNRVPWLAGGSSTGFSLLDSVRRFLMLTFTSTGGLTVVMAASGLVFLWWGLRKSLRMVMGAFRGRRGVSV